MFKIPRSTRRLRKEISASESLEVRALLATFTVTSLADNLDDDGEMTLREAIAEAKTNSGADEIVFEAGLSGVINLQLGDLDLESIGELAITGNGQSDTIIDAQNNSDIFSGVNFRSRRARLTIRSLTLRNARETAVDFSGAYNYLTIEDALITGSGSDAVVTGGSSFDGYSLDVTIRNSTITGSGGRGIILSQAVRLDLEDSEISNNNGGIRSVSGGEQGTPSLRVTRSTIRDNTTTEQGGGISSLGSTLTISDSLITGNQASDGGGIFADYGPYGRSAYISRTTITNNTATGSGGGIFGERLSEFELDNVTISGNQACLLYTSPSPRD